MPNIDIGLEKSTKVNTLYFPLNSVVESIKFNQKSIRPLLDYFDSLIPLSEEEKKLVGAKFHSHLYLKRQFVLQHGNVCNYFNFVVRGCLRLYKVSDDGTWHVLQFANENHWILDLASFHKKKPALLISMLLKIHTFCASATKI